MIRRLPFITPPLRRYAMLPCHYAVAITIDCRHYSFVPVLPSFLHTPFSVSIITTNIDREQDTRHASRCSPPSPVYTVMRAAQAPVAAAGVYAAYAAFSSLQAICH